MVTNLLEVIHMAITGFTRYALVTESGILYQATYYSCPQAIREQWFAKSLVFGAWALPVCYCTSDKSKIYLLNGEQVIACSKVVRCKMAEKHRLTYFTELEQLKVLLKNQRRIRRRVKRKDGRLNV
jgi:hypothetical protein